VGFGLFSFRFFLDRVYFLLLSCRALLFFGGLIGFWFLGFGLEPFFLFFVDFCILLPDLAPSARGGCTGLLFLPGSRRAF